MFQVNIINHETWLICGGRDFADKAMFDDVMLRLTAMWGSPSKIVHGNALGADRMAGEWGKRMAIDVIAVPADWHRYGSAAGPIRNENMLVTYRPKRVIAFPGGRGTADMVKRAQKRCGEIDVIEIKLAAVTIVLDEEAPT
jgi:hypothetical protein